MRLTASLAALALAALSPMGCNASMPAITPAAIAAHGDQAVLKDSGLKGTKAIAVTVVAPEEAGFQTLALVHKWVDADIFEYRATLKVWNGTAYVDLATPTTVTIPRKGTGAKTKAVFTSLKQGSKYQVSLVAFGDKGGTAATAALNSTAPTGVFDFTATQDVEDTQSASLQVTFDKVAFSGSGTTTVTAPADGTYANPTTAEAGTAQ